MSLYILLYLWVIFCLVLIWILFYKKHSNYIYWKYFLLAMLFYSLWLLLYFISFSTTYDKEILLIFSRILYWLSISSIYFILIFIYYFFDKKTKMFSNKYSLFFIFSIISILSLTTFTPYIISDMVYDVEKNIYYEDIWLLYDLYTFLCFINFPLFLFVWYKKYKKINFIHRSRFGFLYLGFFILLFNVILFLAFLPMLWIWLFQKEQILFFIPFIFLSLYSINRYHFLNLKVWIWKIFVFIFSISFSVISTNFFRFYFFSLNSDLNKFWWISKEFWAVDLVLGILLFIILYNYLTKIFLWNNSLVKFEKQLNKLKESIAYIKTFWDLNIFLENQFKHLFKIKYIKIELFTKNDRKKEIYKYFIKDISRSLFINDVVFIEENKYKFKEDKLLKEINKDSYLIYPLYNNNKLEWIFEIWEKPFKDQYCTEEIYILNDFRKYLVWHLKYIKMYSEINYLNKNLDKNLDEKVIELNNLLNKQREFIAMASHEIKTPLWWAILQSDILFDELNSKKLDMWYIEKELWILNKQLVKVWKLVNKIFKVEKFDIKEVKMYFETINIEEFLEEEVELFWKSNPWVSIILKTYKKIWYVDLDKIQIKQVIDNLLTNSIKYSNVKNLEIIISVYSIWEENFWISIEDNWKWFKKVDIAALFEKYSMWETSTIWIWMWLYLCKKIISMHNWWIKAEFSKKLWWAKFSFKIPKKNKNKKF